MCNFSNRNQLRKLFPPKRGVGKYKRVSITEDKINISSWFKLTRMKSIFREGQIKKRGELDKINISSWFKLTRIKYIFRESPMKKK